jgi:vancomycin resistance protein YoaR
MLRLITYNLGFAALLLLTPMTATATGLVYDSQNWEVDLDFDNSAQVIYLRNDFDLTDQAKNIVFGQRKSVIRPLLAPTTLEQVEEIATAINQASRSATLKIVNNRATDFDPGQNRQTLNTYTLKQELLARFDPVRLVVMTNTPETGLADTNQLGINELVATGESDFSGSSASRINNIRVGASKYNGLIIKPGEEFSFNKHLGDINSANGFSPEIVIKGTDLVKEFGGGLCQVSTTVFRAAMNAGLPITERRNHSFAVQYYTPPGTDATIYTGAVDFKFQNNLSGHMMIQTRLDGKKLYYDFYGTKDERVVELTEPRSYDRKSDGSLKAVWERKVTRNGQVLSDDEFHSTYRPPAELKKEATVESNIPNPEAEETINQEGNL